MFFYSATGELIDKDEKVVLKNLHDHAHKKNIGHTHKITEPEVELEYKANGNLVIEKDEKEKVIKAKKAFDPPENPLFKFNHLKKKTPYLEEE